MIAPGLPVELGLQAPEDVVHARVRQMPALMRDEERCRWIGVVTLIARLPVLAELAHRALVQRHTAGLVELGLAHGERAGLEVHIGQREHQCFGHSEPGSGEQPKQGPISRWPQTPCERQPSGGDKQRINLGLGVNMRTQAPVSAAKNALGRDLRGRLELPVMRGEWPHDLQPARCRHGAGALHVLPCPPQDQVLSQRAGVPPGVGIPGKAHEFGGRRRQREAQSPTIIEVALHGLPHRSDGTHNGLPGQGMATALSRPRSTLA